MDWSAIVGLRIFVQSVAPELPRLPDTQWYFVVGLAGGVAATALALLRGPHQWLRVTYLLAALSVGGAIAFKLHGERDLLFSPVNGPRYFYHCRVLHLWLWITLFFEWRQRWLRLSSGVVLAILVATTARHFRMPPLPDLRWRDYASQIRLGAPCAIPINPVPYIYHYPGRRPPSTPPAR